MFCNFICDNERSLTKNSNISSSVLVDIHEADKVDGTIIYRKLPKYRIKWDFLKGEKYLAENWNSKPDICLWILCACIQLSVLNNSLQHICENSKHEDKYWIQFSKVNVSVKNMPDLYLTLTQSKIWMMVPKVVASNSSEILLRNKAKLKRNWWSTYTVRRLLQHLRYHLQGCSW